MIKRVAMALFGTSPGLITIQLRTLSPYFIKKAFISVASFRHNTIINAGVIRSHIRHSWNNNCTVLSFSLLRPFSITSAACKNNQSGDLSSSADVDDSENEEDDMHSNLEYEEMSRQWLRVSNVGHQLLVIQPHIKWGSNKRFNTTPQLQLEEAVALVHSLPKWKVVDKMTISLLNFHKKTFFGSGNFEMLKEKISKNNKISAVFISTQMLRGVQHRELEEAFRVPVFDRYTVVIQIFREHAVTSEAKLQVSMAEIPYLWSRLKGMQKGTLDKQGGGVSSVGGAGETFIEVRKRILSSRENKIKRALQKLRGQRELLRNKRNKQEYPIVAVVGYTNSGKTSLIKALTGDQNMQPEDKLFATLDVTNHLGMLPCRLKVLYVDTVGFISDIPTNLIESFVATLEDAMLADAIIHVRDMSHPDSKAQAENVTATLHSLNLSSTLLENTVVAGNKTDLLSQEQLGVTEWLPVSATKHTGLSELSKKVEEAVLKSTGRVVMVMRVPMGGEETSWLYKETAVTAAEADPENSQYLLLTVVMTPAQIGKFRHYFIESHS